MWWREESEWYWKENKLEKDKRGAYASMTWTEKNLWIKRFNHIQNRGAWGPSLVKKLNNFKTVQAMTSKFSDFSWNLTGDILKWSWRLRQQPNFDNHV